MQILIGFVVMGIIGLVATILALCAALIEFAPALISAALALGALWCWQRRLRQRTGPQQWPAIRVPVAPRWTVVARPQGRAAVPVRTRARALPPPVIVIDAADEDDRRG